MINKNYIPVTGHANLVRDKTSGAILNTDINAWEDYKRKREILREQRRNVEKIPQLEKEISEIKDLLKLILTKIS